MDAPVQTPAQTPAGAEPAGTLFTCVTCHVAFKDPENQRLHFQTEWHAYNLKRKVAILKPVTKAEFEAKVEAQKVKSKEEESKAAFSTVCVPCSKQYSSENAYLNHLTSKKHKENEAKAQMWPEEFEQKTTKKAKNPQNPENQNENENEEELTEEQLIEKKIANAQKLELEDCLFCTHKSRNFDANMKHMAIEHSFMIPDIDFVADLEGLIKYFGEKVSIGNVCLYCNDKGRSFQSLEAVRKHMIDKSHCKIFYEGDAGLEFGDYYDFRPSYPDYIEGEELEDEEVQDPEANAPIIADNDLELVLPNGKVLGHRSLNKYFKQRFRPTDDRTSVQVANLMAEYRALGWYGAKEPANRDSISHLKDRQREKMEIGVAANKLQRHFRRQVDY